ncbi:MAG: hypothetical protein QXH10_09300 [Ignisphaera sp.]
MYITWLRLLDVAPLFSEWAWLQIPLFDLTQLGMVILFDIAPFEFQPYALDYEYTTPSIDEVMQGIWVKFTPVDYTLKYAWTSSVDRYTYVNYKPEYAESIDRTRLKKAYYGLTRYGESYYDPPVQREFVRATLYRLSLMRTARVSYLADIERVHETLDIHEVVGVTLVNRLALLSSAQINAFVLGLSPLGRGRLAEDKDGLTSIPVVDYMGNIYDVKFRTLEHLQSGFILGLTFLGYGFLMPRETIYVYPEGKRNPPFIDTIVYKTRGVINRLSLTAWAYSNYNKPEEMVDYHKSEKTSQYDLLQAYRRHIEAWVEAQITPEEANAVKVRQYQNAVLQAISFRAKRHRWGFQGWGAMTEYQFRDWWMRYWTAQGLNNDVLSKLYEGMALWLSRLREVKLRVGEQVKKTRLRLARLA